MVQIALWIRDGEVIIETDGYWQVSDTEFWFPVRQEQLPKLIEALEQLNRVLNSEKHIIP